MKAPWLFALITILALQASSARAAKEVGNGGNVLVCNAPGMKPIELLDHYEATTLRSLTIDMGDPALAYSEKVKLVIQRIARLNPNRAELYSEWFAAFPSETSFIANGQLAPVPDVGLGIIPNGCQLTQIAVQHDPDLPGDARYTIRQDLWNQLDNDGKAGLVLHELMYREVLHQAIPAQNSRLIRYFNGFVSSTAMAGMRLKQYIELAQQSGFDSADAHNGLAIAIRLCAVVDGQMTCTDNDTVEFYDDNVVKDAKGFVWMNMEDAGYVADVPAPAHPVNWTWRNVSFPQKLLDSSLKEAPCMDCRFDSDGSLADFVVLNGFVLDLGWAKFTAGATYRPNEDEIFNFDTVKVEENNGTVTIKPDYKGKVTVQRKDGSTQVCHQQIQISLAGKKVRRCD